MTRTLRIFLASSAELAEHREQFELAIGRLNKRDFWRQDRRIQFELVLWEDLGSVMSPTRSQDGYNHEIDSCQLFVVLYRSKVGKYTAEEFDKAHARFKATGSPKIWTYFHDAPTSTAKVTRAEANSLFDFREKLAALEHFESVYQHHDTLFLEFAADLERIDGEGFFAELPDQDAAGPTQAAATTRRDRELAHLTALVDRLGQHEPRYVPLAGEETQEQRLERGLTDLAMPSDVVYEDFGFASAGGCALGRAERAVPKPYSDVLKAYRDLPKRETARRLAVLGEPGAGKSFSLGRIACELAHAALSDPAQPVPVLVALGLWTDAAEPLEAFIARRSLPPPPAVHSSTSETPPALLPADLQALRAEGRLLLLLDAVNEIPPGQRRDKVEAIATLAQDKHLAALLLSCRQRDFEAELQTRLPFDTLRLQPLRPWLVRDFLRKTLKLAHGEVEGPRRAEAKFWQIAGGEPLREVWRTWEQAGASFELFWTADEVPKEPNVSGATSWQQDQVWQAAKSNSRSLLRLAENPFLLTVMMQLPAIPPNPAQLFAGFLKHLHRREREARTKRGDAGSVPPLESWRAVLVQVAEALQRVDGTASDDGARTALARADWPAALNDELLAFSIDASVLQRVGDELRFTHQLLQESLAADALLSAARSHSRPARDFWPMQNGWARSGWEEVAAIAAEACAGNTEAKVGLIRWLAETAPQVAAVIWYHVGRPTMPAEMQAATKAKWLQRMTDVEAEPETEARMAIASWLSALDLDDRPGTGLREDGLPDIAWVVIDDPRPFVYQMGTHPPLPSYAIARYPVTNRQWQAFVEDGGYTNDRWWGAAPERPEPKHPCWPEPTAPRENISWYEAMAFCSWLSDRLGRNVSLPTEQQWERAARGVEGREFPWSGDWDPRKVNANDGMRLRRTSLVGLYHSGATVIEGLNSWSVEDMAGNVWEWCLNEYSGPYEVDATKERRAVRGGSWNSTTMFCRGYACGRGEPSFRDADLGFRLVLPGPFAPTKP